MPICTRTYEGTPLKEISETVYEIAHALRKKVDRCLLFLSKDRYHPGIQARKMVNQENIWEARVDLHTRITFQVSNNEITVRAVGTHEIYRKP